MRRIVSSLWPPSNVLLLQLVRLGATFTPTSPAKNPLILCPAVWEPLSMHTGGGWARLHSKWEVNKPAAGYLYASPMELWQESAHTTWKETCSPVLLLVLACFFWFMPPVFCCQLTYKLHEHTCLSPPLQASGFSLQKQAQNKPDQDVTTLLHFTCNL